MKSVIDRLALGADSLPEQPVFSKATAGRSTAAPGLPLTTLVWIGCLGLAAFGVWGYWQGQTGRAYFVDEGVYTHVGWSWLNGKWPYRDVWDHKGPTVYLTTMIRSALGGTDARILGAQEIVVGLAIACLLAAIARTLWGRLGAPVAFAFGILVWAQRPVVDFGTGSADPAHIHMSTPGSLIALFSTAAILGAILAARRAAFSRAAPLALLSGVCSGLAACTKLNAAAGFVVASAILVLMPQRRRAALLLWAIVGALIPFAAFAIVFRVGGAFNEFVDAYFFFNSIRGGLGLPPAEWLRLPLQIVRNLNYAGVVTLTGVTLAASAIGAWRLWRDADDGLVMTAAELLVPLWLILELLVWLSNGGAYAFRVYPVLPAAALGASWAVLAAARSPSIGQAWALVVFVALIAPPALTLDPLQTRARPVANEWRRVAGDLRRTTAPDDTVLALNSWRATSIMSLAQRPTASRYVTPVPLFTIRYTSDARWKELLDLTQGRSAPKVILIGAPPPGADTIPTVAQTLTTFDRPDLRAALIDHAAYPSFERLKTAIIDRYRIDYCVEEICVLRRLD